MTLLAWYHRYDCRLTGNVLAVGGLLGIAVVVLSPVLMAGAVLGWVVDKMPVSR